ncbi:sulfatase [Maribellus maritimus]|uniref:sulfatase n=1 Tax=Maribellus maritimus TaxID=2870838 RepID=UPI001EEB8AAB|nr:sulfatase [Maribellus maritimus]MCG6186013.1 sulfatase [Maribellus maritimus]
MSGRIILMLLVALFITSSCKTDIEQPNIVFILVDDLGWADVQCNYPETFYETLHIDQLAKSGVRFTQAYSANPVCSPTRAAIMTGKHPNRVDITDWIPGADPRMRPLLGPQDRNELALEEITIAEKLNKAGYQTCFIGKWHLGDEGFFPEDQGFDINIGGHEKGSPPGGYYSPYNNPKLTDGPKGEYLTDRLTDESIRFITKSKDNPFFLYLAYYTVHTPIQASNKHIEKYRKKRESLNIEQVPHKKEGEGFTKLLQENADFASMVAAMDENVGRIVETLKQQGLDQNTWIIFTSDNGGLSTLYRENAPTSNGPLRAGKGWCYEGGIRVPLIIAGPEVTNPGRTENTPVVSMDFFPTLLNLAEIELLPSDGVDLSPILTQNTTLTRDELFWHYPHYHGSAWKPGSAIRKDTWKLIVHYEDNKIELFNLDSDPGETTDISTTHPEKVAELKKLLDKKLAETNAKFPEPNPDYAPRD